MARLHAALVNVLGLGVLIRGESAVGKSECALELVQRGHRLVADDVVKLEVVDGADGKPMLIGRSPEMIRHYIEIRGIGLLHIADLYGPDAVQDESVRWVSSVGLKRGMMTPTTSASGLIDRAKSSWTWPCRACGCLCAQPEAWPPWWKWLCAMPCKERPGSMRRGGLMKRLRRRSPRDGFLLRGGAADAEA